MYLHEKGYQLVRFIGKGPSSLVIEATSKEYGNVAVKMFDKDSPSAE